MYLLAATPLKILRRVPSHKPLTLECTTNTVSPYAILFISKYIYVSVECQGTSALQLYGPALCDIYTVPLMHRLLYAYILGMFVVPWGLLPFCVPSYIY
jgi:hypothetical protein